MTDRDLLGCLRQLFRELNGEAAYDRYLQHWRQHHGEEEGEPWSREEFFRSEQDRRWNGVRRCC